MDGTAFLDAAVAASSAPTKNEPLGFAHEYISDASASLSFVPTEAPPVSSNTQSDGTATLSIRDGPAIDEQDGFNLSPIPMITTSPSKHGSNLNAYIDVCHDWIDAEIRNTQHNSKAPPTTLLDAVTISPMRPMRGYDTHGNDGAPTDEEGGLTLSFLNCSSDSSTGPPPPPPPLPPLPPQTLLPIVEADTVPNKACIEVILETYDEYVDAVELEEAVRQRIATAGMEVSPFDEITVTTQELDSTIDTAAAEDGIVLNPVNVPRTLLPPSYIEDTIETVVFDKITDVENGENASYSDITERIEPLEDNGVIGTPNVQKFDVIIEDSEHSAFGDAPLEVEDAHGADNIGDNVQFLNPNKVADAQHQIVGTEDVVGVKDVLDHSDIATTLQAIVQSVQNDDTEVVDPVDDKIVDLIEGINVTNVCWEIEITKTGCIEQEPSPFDETSTAHLNDMNTTVDTATFFDGANNQSTNADLNDTFAETTSSFYQMNEIEKANVSDKLTVEPVRKLEKLIVEAVRQVENAGVLDELIVEQGDTAEKSDGLIVETNHETVFIGDVESPHDKSENTNINMNIPFVGNIMSPSAERESRYPLDEEVLNMSPAELEALVKYVKSTSDHSNDTTVTVKNLNAAGETATVAVADSADALVFDNVERPTNRCCIVEGVANDVLVDHDTMEATVPLKPDSAPFAVLKSSSLESYDLIPDSRYEVIHQELENIEQMIQNPAKPDLPEYNEAIGADVNKKPISERDIMFEHLWKESSSELDSLSNHFENTVQKHVVTGNMDLLSKRNSSAYVDYAKRSATKFQKAKEDILNDVELDKAANMSHGGVDQTSGRENPPISVNADVELSEPAISPVSVNELVRVPTTEETKSANVKTEPVTTTCMETCVLM